MPVEEKIKRLKREKTTHSTQKLDRLGWARYEEVRRELEAKKEEVGGSDLYF